MCDWIEHGGHLSESLRYKFPFEDKGNVIVTRNKKLCMIIQWSSLCKRYCGIKISTLLKIIYLFMWDNIIYIILRKIVKSDNSFEITDTISVKHLKGFKILKAIPWSCMYKVSFWLYLKQYLFELFPKLPTYTLIALPLL